MRAREHEYKLPKEDSPLLLPRLVGQGRLLPVLHDVGEGELEVLVHLGGRYS